MSGNISGRLDRDTAGKPSTKRASLGVRIMLAAFAVLSIAFAVLAGVNIAAQRQYDAATQTLTENLETASRNDADLKQLLTSQQELDARFANITGKSAVLLPQISESTTYNAQVSKQLTDLVQQQVDADAAKNDSQQSGQHGEQPKSLDSLTEEQRKQVEELLRSNEELGKSEDSTNESNGGQGEGENDSPSRPSNVKPW